jgi:excisionase family DNA binding protein
MMTRAGVYAMSEEVSPEILLTKQDAADRLKVSPRTIDRLRDTKAICWVPVGRQVRFRESDLREFIAKQAVEVKP